MTKHVENLLGSRLDEGSNPSISTINAVNLQLTKFTHKSTHTFVSLRVKKTEPRANRSRLCFWSYFRQISRLSRCACACEGIQPLLRYRRNLGRFCASCGVRSSIGSNLLISFRCKFVASPKHQVPGGNKGLLYYPLPFCAKLRYIVGF